jgi:hypothetical protein
LYRIFNIFAPLDPRDDGRAEVLVEDRVDAGRH